VTLSDWARNGWLLPHRTSPREIADLLAIVDRDLADSQASGLSADWRLNIAYNAALQAATAALAASGYRASRDQHHYRVIQSLELTARIETSSTGWMRSGKRETSEATSGQAGYRTARRPRCGTWHKASRTTSGPG
jgi:hypothetical protein